ncbi:lysophospholipid acyltransferase family protein [Pedobacter cryophilus]|uniref:Lipid A biosynthesis acyltransferase n=1 Tax=Pedobacter cryophilus TaxID=2571271 RepID=A0A4U1BXT3_9SPHI|nr:lysophospholipid acyltransferase family protein [Pedobacter cryophilus]TKB97565.1 lipid A biosynthesis acyltransferase [Pedobacter cryophilus]
MINKGLSKVAIFFLYLISLLPLGLLYILSDFIFFILFYVIKYRRNVVFDNLKNSFPLKSEEELRSIEKTYFSYLADLMVETIKMLSASPQFLQKRYSLTNKDLIDKYESQNKSYLIAVGHYGNWEWNTVVTPLTLKAKPLIIYKPMNNEDFDDFFKKAREKSGTLMIRMKLALREIVKRKSELTATVFASDQTPAHGDAQDWIQFLNQPTSVFVGLEKIAKSTNFPVVFCDIRRVKRGYYSCDFKSVCENPAETADLEITKKHVSLLEDRINQEPAYWLWSHKRWKYKPQKVNE